MNYFHLVPMTLALGLLGGCGNNYERIANDLRTTTLQQEQQIAALKQQVTNHEATIASLRSSTPTLPTLPPDRLATLYTAATLQILPRTDAWDWQGDKSPDGLRIFLRTQSAEGVTLPATGELTLEAFDLAIKNGDQRIGTWTFTAADMKKNWYASLGSNYFAFNCPLPALPANRDITFKARFVDALTGNTLVAQTHKRLTLP